MSYKKSNWVPYDPTLSFEQNVTQGGTTTADKLNNMETGIGNAFDKTSDTIGGRNLVKESEQEFAGKAYDFHGYKLASLTELAPGKTYTVSFSVKVDDKAVKCNQRIFVDIYNSSWSYVEAVYVPISTDYPDYQRVTKTFTLPEGQTGINIITVYLEHPVINGNSDSTADKSDVAGTGYIKEFKLEQGSIATDWTPAPEDKVNVSDMRKPASDVVGLDEIKSSILPNGTDFYTLINTSGHPLSYYALAYTSAQTMVNKPATKLSAFKLTTASIGDNTSSKYNYTLLTLKDQWDGSIYEALLTTNGSGAVSVARPWYKVADDSKVAHLSGANNFDTVPTVNNNPLLLASSLPSDIARTGQDTNFTGKLQRNGKDVATTDDVATASNTVLTSANTSISKLLQSSSNNDEDSAVTNSTSDTSNFYYWTE